MEPPKKNTSLKKRWLKRLTRRKITKASTTSADSQNSDTTSSQKNSVDQHVDNRRSRDGVFGSLRRVHNRFKLCVLKRKDAQRGNSVIAEQCSSSRSLEESNSRNALATEVSNLANCCWYWGPLSRRETEEKLKDLPDGSFLIRDSFADEYIFSISFRSLGRTLHSHIDHVTGQYRLFNTTKHRSIAELVDHAVKASQNSIYCYTKPRNNANPRFPIRLLTPVSRFTHVRSLQHLCRFVIRQTTNINNIARLPIPLALQNYLKQGQY